MSTRLADFQDRFAQALFGAEEDADPEVASLARQPGFAVYRNTVIKGRIDALQANYPSVTRLVGEAWFRAAAAIYANMDRSRVVEWLALDAGSCAFLDMCMAERPVTEAAMAALEAQPDADLGVCAAERF